MIRFLLKGLVRDRSRSLFPVVCTSATHMIGAQPLMDLIVNLAPAPGERGPNVGHKPGDAETTLERPVADDEPISAFVFKTAGTVQVAPASVERDIKMS